jgi:DNA-binding winged helix-turn-helix (wHTH) protein
MQPRSNIGQTRVRFGAFELDLRSGELRPLEANGMRTIVLQEQPFQVLRLLLERYGELATREEIRKNLWPNDTAVDFNHSINVAIGTLRRALRDSTEDPKYIQTVARSTRVDKSLRRNARRGDGRRGRGRR